MVFWLIILMILVLGSAGFGTVYRLEFSRKFNLNRTDRLLLDYGYIARMEREIWGQTFDNPNTDDRYGR